MDITQAATVLRPGTAWNFRDGVLEQAQDGTTRVTVPTIGELQPVMDSDTTPAAILTAQRTAAVSLLLTDPSSNAKTIRAILLTILDELNVIRQWLESFKATTAAATTLADLKTRVAALPAMPDRTAAQGKTSVQSKINAGTAD